MAFDERFLHDVILGPGRCQHFEAILPAYVKFLSTRGNEDAPNQPDGQTRHKNSELWFLDEHRMVGDFYRWLKESGHEEEYNLIDRRSGIDRRGGYRPENPGRRDADLHRSDELIIEKSPDNSLPS